MKLAVLADIHANLSGPLAVAAHVDAWRPDQVIVAGDVANRGPRPVECLAFVQERQRSAGWLVVRGNEEMLHSLRSFSMTSPNGLCTGPGFLSQALSKFSALVVNFVIREGETHSYGDDRLPGPCQAAVRLGD